MPSAIEALEKRIVKLEKRISEAEGNIQNNREGLLFRAGYTEALKGDISETIGRVDVLDKWVFNMSGLVVKVFEVARDTVELVKAP